MDVQDDERASVSRRPAVMADVGRLAGVSHQTVSRVINGSRHVSPATRERVLQAMRELGYRPNSAARTLVTGRSRTLGVVSVDTTLYGPASTLFGIERAAHQAGYFIIVASLRAMDRSSVADAVGRLRMQGVEGVLVIVAERDAAEALQEMRIEVPLVAVESGLDHGIPVVAVDQRLGATMATRHLLDLGHATVHHVSGPPQSIEAELRVDGWRATLEQAGAPCPPVVIGDWSARAGYHLGSRLARDESVTGVFVGNDQMALGLLRAMHEAGRRIPEEISVVGFDDIPEATYFMPPLTTVRQDFGEIGSRSLRTLLDAISAFGGVDGGPKGGLVAPELIVRASTATAAGRSAAGRTKLD